MTDDSLRRRAIALYDRFTHETHDRRAFMADLIKLAGSAAAAEALLLGIAADPAAATIVPPDDQRVRTRTSSWTTAPGRTLTGYRAVPATAKGERLPTVLVIHENRGLNDHIRDVARRIALAGFIAVAPDFLSPAGGTPADEDKARAMIGALDLARTTDDAVATARMLAAEPRANGKVGAVGFCWGGALTNRLAVAAGASLAAAVAYYGPAPDPAEAAKVRAPLLLHYAGLDERVAQTGGPWVAALKAAHKDVTAFTYPGVNHAFNNDTAGDRYDAAAATLAWGRTIAFLKEKLT